MNDLIPNITITDLKKKLLEKQKSSLKSKFSVLYDVYLPDKNFKKSQPGVPLYQVFTSNESAEILKWPSLKDFILNNSVYLTEASPETMPRFLYAFVDNGEALYYSFKCDQSMPCVY